MRNSGYVFCCHKCGITRSAKDVIDLLAVVAHAKWEVIVFDSIVPEAYIFCPACALGQKAKDVGCALRVLESDR